MIDSKQTTAVVVTKGGADLSEIVASLSAFDEVLVQDNSVGVDWKVYGRYFRARSAKNETLFVQDDDCIVDVEALLAIAVPGRVTCNMPVCRRTESYYHSTGIALVGWGAVFEKRHMNVFGEFLERHPIDDLFLRESDRAFTRLNRDEIDLVDVPFRNLSSALGKDRMGTEARHRTDFFAMLRRLEIFESPSV